MNFVVTSQKIEHFLEDGHLNWKLFFLSRFSLTFQQNNQKPLTIEIYVEYYNGKKSFVK